MANFLDRSLHYASWFSVLSSSQLPRYDKARIVESAPVRNPTAIVALRGGHSAPDGDTLHDVVSVSIRVGFDTGQYGDHTLVSGNCVVEVASSDMAREPKPGDSIWIGLGVDPANFITVFRGTVENVKAGVASRSYTLSCFDSLRRLQELPYSEPSDSTDFVTAYETLSGGDEDGLPDDVRHLLDDLLSAGDVLAVNGTGILQYPSVSNERGTLFDEISDLLRSAQLIGYLSPGGELLVTFSDDNPIWSAHRNSDLGTPGNPVWIDAGPYDNLNDLPLRSSVSIWPTGLPTHYNLSPFWPNRRQFSTLRPFRFSPHNVVNVQAVESTLVVNEVRSRTTPESNLRDFIDLSALSFQELETLQFSQLGEGSTSDATVGESVAEYGLRWRTYSLGGLAEVPRSTQSVSGTQYGRYTLDRESYSDSQAAHRAYPHQRIQIQSPGILSVLPFDIVEVDLPDEGYRGLYMIEGRRLDVSGGGFRTTDILKYVGVAEQLVTLDVRGAPDGE